MEWKSLEEFPDYQFSDTGIVKKGNRYLWTFLQNEYPTVTLSNGFVTKRIKIHHAVAELFIGPRPEGQVVRHLDDDKENNHVSNIAYGTHRDNVADAIRNDRYAKGERNGTKTHPEKVPKGENHSKSKLTKEMVIEIRNTENYHGCTTRLAEKFNVSRNAIIKVRDRKSWCCV